MLRFNRPSFRSGAMIVKVTVDNTDTTPVASEIAWTLRPSQKNSDVDFTVAGYDTAVVEAALVAKYPAFLTVIP